MGCLVHWLHALATRGHLTSIDYWVVLHIKSDKTQANECKATESLRNNDLSYTFSKKKKGILK